MDRGEHAFHAEQGDRDWWQVGIRACTLAVLPRDLSGMRSLDLGAGPGYFVRELVARGADARGVELDSFAVEQAPRLGVGDRIVEGRLQEALPRTAELDLVSMLDVLPHREVDEAEVLAGVGNSLAPAGRLLLRLPAYQWLYGPHDRYVHQIRRYSLGDVPALCAAAGLSVERITFANCVLFGAVLASRIRRGRDGGSYSYNQVRSGSVNRLLLTILLGEAALIGRGARLPWGTSLIVLLRKPGRP
jgi:SAM-dependent methyltransferase